MIRGRGPVRTIEEMEQYVEDRNEALAEGDMLRGRLAQAIVLLEWTQKMLRTTWSSKGDFAEEARLLDLAIEAFAWDDEGVGREAPSP